MSCSISDGVLRTVLMMMTRRSLPWNCSVVWRWW
jgi:hypothetical protein